MNTITLSDELCSINIAAEKAGTVLNEVLNEYYCMNTDVFMKDENTRLKLLRSYELVQTFLTIASDYIIQIEELSGKLEELCPVNIKIKEGKDGAA